LSRPDNLIEIENLIPWRCTWLYNLVASKLTVLLDLGTSTSYVYMSSNKLSSSHTHAGIFRQCLIVLRFIPFSQD
jgi:hypothetical protein